MLDESASESDVSLSGAAEQWSINGFDSESACRIVTKGSESLKSPTEALQPERACAAVTLWSTPTVRQSLAAQDNDGNPYRSSKPALSGTTEMTTAYEARFKSLENEIKQLRTDLASGMR